MNTSLEVDITQRDCDEGCRGTERYCVVATAVARLVPEASRIQVNVNTIRFSVKEDGKVQRLAYRTPEPVRDYIRAFDAGSKATPMRFTLDDPQVAVKEPEPKLKAKTASFKPQPSAKTRRSVRVFGEKTFQEVS